MSVLQVSLIAMVAVLLAIQLKGGRAEYGSVSYTHLTLPTKA